MEDDNIKIKIDMTGWVMSEHGVLDSRLTVIERANDYISPKGIHCAQWLCECSCQKHNRFVVCGKSIRSGLTLSCGCLQKERASMSALENNKKYNTYDLSEEYGIGYASNTNSPFYFDLKNYDKIKDYCWAETVVKGVHRLTARCPNKTNHITMHALLGFKNYDHIDRNELNNMENNLRECTQKENTRNRSLHKHNTSGVTGVRWVDDINKWRADIGVNYNRIYLGLFNKKDDAIRARLEAEIKYFKEFAPQKHLFKKYGINIQQNDLDKENDNGEN